MEAADAKRFPGDCYSLDSGEEARTPLCKQPVTQAPVQHYPGVGPDEVVVPFLLIGRANFKTGAVTLEKTHVHLVFNSITYEGRMRVIRLDEQGREHEEDTHALIECMEAASAGRDARKQVHALRFEMNARWSRASVAVIARVHLPEQQEAAREAPKAASSAQNAAAASMQDVVSPSASANCSDASSHSAGSSDRSSGAVSMDVSSSDHPPSHPRSALSPVHSSPDSVPARSVTPSSIMLDEAVSSPSSPAAAHSDPPLAAAPQPPPPQSLPQHPSSPSSGVARKHDGAPAPPSPRSDMHGQHSG
jgi:hypothetical protein